MVRHVVTAARRTAMAASVPDAAATPCQANRFLFGMSWLCPERVAVNRPVCLECADGQPLTMIGFLLIMLVVGIIAGFLARLLVPGRDPMGFWATVLLGIIGSFIGGFLGYVLFGKDLDEGALQASGIFGSVIGAVIALLIYRAINAQPPGHAAPLIELAEHAVLGVREREQLRERGVLERAGAGDALALGVEQQSLRRHQRRQ